MRRIAVINQKGGVGKTTSCCNIGATIAAAGHRVLLIDLDPQAHLTMHLGVEPDGDKPSIYNVLTDQVPLTEASIPVRENLTLIPSHIDLAAAEMELVSVMGREVILRDAVRNDPRTFDFMLIDCPPSLGVLTINGLAAVNEIVVPMQPHFLALQGVGKLLETIGLVRDRINPELSVSGIILCMYEAGTRLAGEVSADLASFLENSRGTDRPWSGAVVYKTIIRRNIKLAECPSHGQTIAEYAPQSNGAIDYASVTAEVLGVDASALKPARAARSEQAAAPTRSRAHAEKAPEDSATVREEVTVSEANELVAAADSETMPAFDTGDRVAFGPDVVTSAPAELDAQPALSNIATEVEGQVDDDVATNAEVATAPSPASQAPPRRSIPVIYADEAEAPALTGAHRD